jgi:hypothetical protein
VDFAYRNADWLLEYHAKRTVDASAGQRDLWRPVLDDTLQRHREEELPLVVGYLQLAESMFGQSNSSAGAACLLDGALYLYERHARLAVDLSVPLLSGLDSTQVRHLGEYAAKRQEKAVKRYLNSDLEHRKHSRQERFFERIERWTGKLNSNQRQQVNEALERIPDLSESWLTYREQKTHRLLLMLEADANATALREYLTDWWVRQDGRSAEDRRLWEVAKQELVLLLDGLAATLTPEQHATLEKRLGDLRDDLTSFLSSTDSLVSLPAVVPVCASA